MLYGEAACNACLADRSCALQGARPAGHSQLGTNFLSCRLPRRAAPTLGRSTRPSCSLLLSSLALHQCHSSGRRSNRLLHGSSSACCHPDLLHIFAMRLMLHACAVSMARRVACSRKCSTSASSRERHSPRLLTRYSCPGRRCSQTSALPSTVARQSVSWTRLALSCFVLSSRRSSAIDRLATPVCRCRLCRLLRRDLSRQRAGHAQRLRPRRRPLLLADSARLVERADAARRRRHVSRTATRQSVRTEPQLLQRHSDAGRPVHAGPRRRLRAGGGGQPFVLPGFDNSSDAAADFFGAADLRCLTAANHHIQRSLYRPARPRRHLLRLRRRRRAIRHRIRAVLRSVRRRAGAAVQRQLRPAHYLCCATGQRYRPGRSR